MIQRVPEEREAEIPVLDVWGLARDERMARSRSSVNGF